MSGKRTSRTGKGGQAGRESGETQIAEQEEIFALPEAVSDFSAALSAHGNDLLIRSRAAWELGDWAVLADLAAQPLEDHKDRAKLALLAAVGLAQGGRMDDARRYALMAQGWGCPGSLMAQVLIGGVMNSLGRVASLLDDGPQARGYFESSVRIVNPRVDAAILGRARDINEKAALGLLPEAAAVMGETLDQMRATQAITAPEARMFQSQVELLNGALILAQKRHQLTSAETTSAAVLPLEQRSVSQLGQDLWVLEQTGHKRGGFFVEFGATDGVLLSNTLLLEAEFAWRGICAEPNPNFFRKLQANRSCTVARDCIMGETGRSVEFILADEYGGAAEYADYDSHAEKREAFRASGRVMTLQSISLDDFLKKYEAPRTIDYLSIDTEGSEYEILSTFPLHEWDIRLLTVEHNFTPIREDIRVLLEGHGYIRTERQWDDWYSKTPP